MVLKQSRDCEKWLIVAISLICKALCVNVHKEYTIPSVCVSADVRAKTNSANHVW